MDFEVHWSRQASRDLRSIAAYLGGREPDAIEPVVEAITSKLNLLSTQPFLGHVFYETPARVIRETLAGSYRIYYEVDESGQQITITRIVHVRRQAPDFSE